MHTWIETRIKSLFREVDAASLACFRILFGLLLAWETVRFLPRIQTRYLATSFPFRYDYFEFLPTPSARFFELLFLVMGVAACCLAVGFCYRLAAALLWFTYTYVFLLEQTSFNNHYYLTSILCFFFIVTNGQAAYSIDAWSGRNQQLRGTIPFWQLAIFRGQLFIVYFYGGIAKINADWLRCEPMRRMLAERAADFPIEGFLQNEWVVHFFAYGGLIFDLAIGFLLLSRRTRSIGVVLLCFFHVTNNWLFDIGIFPWLGIAATIVFFEPETPRRLWTKCCRCAAKLMGRDIGKRHHEIRVRSLHDLAITWSTGHSYIATLIAIYFCLQLLLPLRHFLYPGNVSWTEEGHNFSWHMKLRSKDGMYLYRVHDPRTGKTERFPQDDYLTERQKTKMATRPQLLLQFAHFIRDEYKRKGIDEVAVYVDSIASLNGRPYQRLIRPNVNLAKVPRRRLGWDRWIVPLRPQMEIGDYPQSHDDRVSRMRTALGERQGNFP